MLDGLSHQQKPRMETPNVHGVSALVGSRSCYIYVDQSLASLEMGRSAVWWLVCLFVESVGCQVMIPPPTPLPLHITGGAGLCFFPSASKQPTRRCSALMLLHAWWPTKTQNGNTECPCPIMSFNNKNSKKMLTKSDTDFQPSFLCSHKWCGVILQYNLQRT